MRRSRARAWALLSVLVGAAVGVGAGCGGDDTASSGGDASTDGATTDATATDSGGETDGTVQDSGHDAGHDAGPSDAGHDANDAASSDADAGPVACSTAGASCATGGGQNGICQGGFCLPCSDPSMIDGGVPDGGTNGDMQCAAAYGGDAGAAYICKAGSCVMGTCHSSATCAGQICSSTTNTCTACANDTQCMNDPAYPNTICETAADAGATGTCVSSSCTTANAACPQNAADFCCAGGGGNTCVAGNCCDDSQCAGMASTPACVGHTCTACDAVSNATYYVDPVNGSDANGNGSGKAGGQTAGACAFKTVTKALSVIGSPSAATQIIVLGASTADASEVFPWDVPANTSITSQGGVVTVNVSAGNAVKLSHASSSISGFTIDGKSTAANGVVVSAAASMPSTTGSTSVGAITLQNFNSAGLRVESGGVTVKPGTVGTTDKAGLYVTGTGVVVIDGTDNTKATTSFNSNTASGIAVDATGQLTVNAVITTGASTVETKSNGLYGIGVRHDATNGQPPLVALNNVVSSNSGQIGVGLWGGSNVKVRGSLILGNATGVRIQGHCSGTDPLGASIACTAPSWDQDTSTLDFGKALNTDNGGNTLQATSSGNTSTGLCYAIGPNQSQTLWAIGNKWVDNGMTPANVDCATTAATLSMSASCAAGSSWGGSGRNGNTIHLEQCQ